jgi:hypothetical protein
MALAIDGTAAGKSTNNSATLTAALTTASAGDIIVVYVFATNYQSPTPIISSVTVGGNAATLRNSVAYQGNINFGAGGGTFSNTYNLQAVYWYYASGTLTSASVVANMNTTYDSAIIFAFGVTGFTGTNYQTNPWDQTATSAAAFAAQQPSTTTTGTAIASASNISTVSASSLIFSLIGSTDFEVYNGSPGAIAGTTATALAAGNQYNSDNLQMSAAVEYRILSATISSASAAFSASGGTSGGWAILTDALALAGGGGGGSTITFTMQGLTGVGIIIG